MYDPLESELGRAAPEIAVWLPDIGRRMRTESLRLDLGVPGNNRPEALARAAPIPPLPSAPEQLGRLYVLEGSSLGGQIISREIGNRLQYTPERGCAFFAGYGAETGGMWKALRGAAESFGASHREPGIHDRIVNSAIAVFRAFGDGLGRKQ